MGTGNLSHALPPPPPPGGAPRARRDSAPRAVSAEAMLQVAVLWHGTIIGYRLQRRRRKVTLGPHKRATFCTPSIRASKKFVLLAPRKNGYVLHLAPELRGELNVGG